MNATRCCGSQSASPSAEYEAIAAAIHEAADQKVNPTELRKWVETALEEGAKYGVEYVGGIVDEAINETGELFAVRLGGVRAGGGRVELLAHVPDDGMLTGMLSGWRDICGTFDSMRWLRGRVAVAHPLKRRYGWAPAA